MKHGSFRISDRTSQQMLDLAKLWGESTERYNTPVIARCVELVWLSQFGDKELEELSELDQKPSE
ncbi:hypothetical protein KFU94_49140 [Chloroflexi bacterium TSY]|nr:hypothetical protein [Chloroflexi bacterium TSY]